MIVPMIVGITMAALHPALGASDDPRSPDDPLAAQQARADLLLQTLRDGGRVEVAAEMKLRLERSAREVKARGLASHTIYGRVVVQGPDDAKRVDAQMRILEDGYFVDPVKDSGKPVGFRLHGYEPVDVIPVGGPGSIEDVGMVVLRPIGEQSKASLRAKVVLEGQPGAPGVRASLGIKTGPINNLSGGYEGVRGLPIPPIPIGPDGILAGSGYVPTEHYLNISAPGYWMENRTVDLRPGQALDLGTIPLELGEMVTATMMVANGPSFADSRPATVTADAAGGWRVRDAGHETDYLLFLFRPGGASARIRSSHGPLEMADLGTGAIEEMAQGDHSKVALAYEARLPAESGHVYLGRWRFGREPTYVLLHLKMEKMTVEAAGRLKPGRP